MSQAEKSIQSTIPKTLFTWSESQRAICNPNCKSLIGFIGATKPWPKPAHAPSKKYLNSSGAPDLIILKYIMINLKQLFLFIILLGLASALQ